mgnify:FL=1
MDYEKAIKNAKYFAIGILVLAILVFCFNLFSGGLNTLSIFIGIAKLIFIFATIKGLNEEQLYGPICGIIVSVLMILNRDIISIVFGILYLIDCIKIVNYMRNN